MTKKKILLVALTLCMVAILAVGGSLAYFTAEDEATNVFTVGDVQIDLTEPSWVPPTDVYPTQTIAKDPTVKNTGSNPCFVRIKVTGLDCLVKAELSAENIALSDLGADWELSGDYYYYKKAVVAGTETTALFTTITIPADTVNALGEDDVDYNIGVFAEAVQSQGFEGELNVADLADWFKTCGL